MIKYIILGFNNPNITNSSAQISYYTGNDFSDEFDLAKKYNTRAEAEDEIKDHLQGICCITYGVEVK